jgi:hypothetical protein
MEDDEIEDIDLNLDHSQAKEIFHDDEHQDIWSQPNDDEESDTPAFLRKRKFFKKNDKKEEEN